MISALTFSICRKLDASVLTTKRSAVMVALPAGFFGILFGTSYRRISVEANSTIMASTIFSALTLAVTIGWDLSLQWMISSKQILSTSEEH